MKRMNFRKILVSLAIVFNITPVALVLTPSVVHAQASTAVCEGIGQAGGNNTGCNQTNGPSVESIIRLSLNLLSLIIGVVAVVMIMVGGLRYITSGGDSGKTASAKDTILYAVIGLVVVALAQIVVKFVLKKVVK
jgi:hypothetical protein